MATDEVNKPPSLPDYSEMILEAIEALDGKEGSNKTAITDYISENHSDLPENHAALVMTHLTKMKESGDLVFAKNNYMKASTEAASAPKRGRGRPPKPKTPLPADAVISPPRPRGRPPKPKDPLAVNSSPMKKTPTSSGKPRGRPPKAAVEGSGSPAVTTTASPRPRGRPPKVKAQVAAVGV